MLLQLSAEGNNEIKQQLIKQYMKDLLICSLDELLTERQVAIEAGNVDRYRECNELISTIIDKKVKELDIVDMFNTLKEDNHKKASAFDMSDFLSSAKIHSKRI